MRIITTTAGTRVELDNDVLAVIGTISAISLASANSTTAGRPDGVPSSSSRR